MPVYTKENKYNRDNNEFFLFYFFNWKDMHSMGFCINNPTLLGLKFHVIRLPEVGGLRNPFFKLAEFLS